VTDSECSILRQRNKEYPGEPSELIDWFLQQHRHNLDQGQVSRILSSKHNYVGHKHLNISISWPVSMEHGVLESFLIARFDCMLKL
jgi:hypothetical protein